MSRSERMLPLLSNDAEMLRGRRVPSLSVRGCIGLAVAAGLLGLTLMRVVPVGTDHEYLARYAVWARELQEMFEACGKHEPRDVECVRRHPVRQRP